MPDPIPHSRPDLGAAEADAARRVVASGRVAGGVEVGAFEEEVAAEVGRRYGVAVSSGTAALHLALQALGVGETARVLVPSYVCSALVHAVRAVGAEVALADVEADSGNLDPEAAESLSDRCAAAVVPHMFGRPADAAAHLAPRLPVVEDLAMALGAGGVGTHGVAAVCSFYATKVITSGGEGGMVLTDDEGLADAVRGLREYDGLSIDRGRYNFKLTDVAAAVGRVQLRRLGAFVERRRALAARYEQALADLPARRPSPCAGDIHYRFVARVAADVDEVIDRFEAEGIAARRPVVEPLHHSLSAAGSFPGTEAIWHSALSLPLYPALGDDEAERVIEASRQVLSSTVVAV